MLNPTAVWSRAQDAIASLPAQLTLHHTIPTPDGRRAICVWEAESVEDLRAFLDPALGADARNEYMGVVNKEGIALPTALQPA